MRTQLLWTVATIALLGSPALAAGHEPGESSDAVASRGLILASAESSLTAPSVTSPRFFDHSARLEAAIHRWQMAAAEQEQTMAKDKELAGPQTPQPLDSEALQDLDFGEEESIATPDDPTAPVEATGDRQPPTVGPDRAGDGPPDVTMPWNVFIPAEEPGNLRAGEIIGRPVINLQGEEVGSVEDVIFDSEGRVIGLVVSVGGFLGIGAESVAVAWKSSKVTVDPIAVVIDLSAQEVAEAPRFVTVEDQAAAGDNTQPVEE